MVTTKRLLLLNGSPRKKGTSCSFARTLASLATEAGCTVELEHVYDYADGRRSLAALREQIGQSDLIGLLSPLYFDTLPGAVVWLFEELHREALPELRGKRFFAIGQCAYPFASLNQPLLDSSRCFAEAVGMRWMGGLGYGLGVLIDGAPLERLGKKGATITTALRLALADLLRDEPIAAGAQELLTMHLPRLLYRPLALLMNLRVWWQGRRHGVDPACRVYG